MQCCVQCILFSKTAWQDAQIMVTGNKFCQVRWAENTAVANRTLELVDDIKKYINDKLTKLPGTVTYIDLKQAVSDPLTTGKMAFFASCGSVGTISDQVF